MSSTKTTTIEQDIQRVRDLNEVLKEQLALTRRAKTEADHSVATKRLTELRTAFWQIQNALIWRWQRQVGIPTAGAYADVESFGDNPQLFELPGPPQIS